ncbi:cation-translocating P-type ATPase [Fusobacterium sp.]|uniref:cation-translocating P-type ATPase n=1 Tax=Fusobacterium sp. TaxID=68766 RepID=UPI00260A1D3F|nr:cation-translocating P-type ATPase [Fusobacterium sp.]
MKKHFFKSKEEVLREFSVTLNGLSKEQVENSKKLYGVNELQEQEKEKAWAIFLSQFKDFLVIILIIAGIISMLTGNIESTIVIFAVIIMNAILGTVQHLKAESSLESLRNMASPKAKVMRDGQKIEIHSKDIVEGDIVYLEAGDIVPADGRVIESFSLMVNESSLTGESESVDKYSEIISEENIPLGDQKNMVFSGSLVTYGRGVIVITAVGMKTELGKIASLIKDTKEKATPLQVSLDNFGKKLSISILILCGVVFVINFYHGVNLLDSILFAVALAVAAIPEALGSIVTIVLAIGTQKMSKENAIIKKLKAVEGLGSVSVICSDKTGTLTQNKMTSKKIYVNEKIINVEDIDLNDNYQKMLLNFGALCSDASSEGGKEIGDPTEVALTNLVRKFNISELELRKEYPRLSEIPFDSDRKLMSTLHKIDEKIYMVTKGALDILLKRVKYIYDSEGIREITEEDIKRIEEVNYEFSNNGLRVLAFTFKNLSKEKALIKEDENDYVFLGLISMIDPPREESKEAVTNCLRAGIKPVMITGDHKVTAVAIAKEIGIFKDGDKALNGIELSAMSDEELHDVIENVSVYARVSPEDKIRIVSAWQSRGKICAMTGDGVNDAPALKKADIGIAMGITGTEVSKDAASMILTDDNFATIIKAVATGRNIYSNIKNSIRFLLSGNMGGILSVFYASLVGLPMPFAPVHLLFINLVTDSLPAIAIGMESGKDDVLEEKPRDINQPILDKNLSLKIMLEGLLIAVFTMIGYYLGFKNGGAKVGSTMAFAILCLGRLFHGFNCRGKNSMLKLGLFSNKYSVLAFLVGTFLLNVILFNQSVGSLFEVAKLTTSQILYIYVLAFIPTIVVQVCRFIKYDLKEK